MCKNSRLYFNFLIKCVALSITAHEHTLEQDENTESKVQEDRGKSPSHTKYARFLSYV